MTKKVQTRKWSLEGPSEKNRMVDFQRFTLKGILTISLISGFYLLWMYAVVGLRTDHVYVTLACCIFYFASKDTRNILIGIGGLMMYWFIYDSLRIFPNYMFNTVHVAEPYQIEKALFGISTGNGIITPNEYFKTIDNTFLDVISGAFYLTWTPVPLIFAFWLYFYDKAIMIQYNVAFFLANILGMTGYYLYPAAPPWYVELYGFGNSFEMIGNAAGLIGFDEFFGVDLYKEMYEKNANVFAAIPSMHSAFPVLSVFYAYKKRMKILTFLFCIQTAGIWFAAVYTNHHYIIDVLLGGLTAILTIVIMEGLVKHKRTGKWFKQYETIIS